MKVYISVDIEGITGLVSWQQCGRADSQHYDFGFARRMMTHDANAAIRGAKAAGATAIVLKDSHGNSKSLLIDDLEPGVELISGHGSGTDGMMEGLDSSFDAAMLVGYHARAGTLGGIMEHTITGGVHRLWLNGQEAGEIALSAGVAGRYGVPLVMISSDAAGCDEARALLPWISTAAVKEGKGRYMGRVLHPRETGRLIEQAASAGLENLAIARPYVVVDPCTVAIEFNLAEEADYGARLNGVTRTDAYTLEATCDTYEAAHRAAWSMFGMSFTGRKAGE